MTLLDAFTSILDAETLSRLGDPVIYTRAAVPGAPLSINAHVDHRDDIDGVLGGSVVAPSVVIQVRKVDVPAPVRGDQIQIPRRGETRKITSVETDRSGGWWILSTAKS